MRRLLPGGLAGIALALALLVATASGTALGFFTTTGSGSTSAGISKLTAPAISAATPGIDGTVALTWGAISPPAAGAVTYSVTRNGGVPAGNCPSSDSPAPVTICTDTAVGIGTHSYVVTAKWRSWSAVSSTKTAKVTVGPVTHLDIKAASATPAAGATNNLTITAQDANDATVTTYTGSHSLIFSGASASPSGTKPTVSNSSGTAIAFGSATAINFTNGVATVSSTKNGVMRLYRSGATTIEVSESSLTSSPDLDLTVASLSATKITLGVTATSQTAGATNDLTVTATDTYGNLSAAYTGSRNLTFSGASASNGGNAPTVSNSSGTPVAFGSATAIDFDAGEASVSEVANGVMTLYKSGPNSLKVSDGSLTSAAVVVTVAFDAAVRLSLTASVTMPAAGGTSSLTTTAVDLYGNTVTTYTGSRNLIFSGASASPNGTVPTVVNSAGTATAFGAVTAINFSSGVASVSSSKNGVMRLYSSGATSIAVSDGTIATTTPLAVTVNTASASRLAFANASISAGTLGSTCLFTCAVTTLGNSGTIKANVLVTDTYGNTINSIGSGRAVKITASSGGTISGTPLAINSTGPATTAAQFTYTAPASGSFSHTITAATSEGTTYTSATMTASK
jgi:hypothetical protein